MTMFCANHATTAAAADAACSAARTFSHNIALILDAALLASIFVAAVCALLGSGIISIIVISIISIIAIITVMIIVLLVTASGRYGEPT